MQPPLPCFDLFLSRRYSCRARTAGPNEPLTSRYLLQGKANHLSPLLPYHRPWIQPASFKDGRNLCLWLFPSHQATPLRHQEVVLFLFIHFFILFLFCPPLTTVTVSQRFQARINIIDLGCIALHLHSRFLEPIGGWGWNKSLTKSDQGNRRSTSYLPGRQHGSSWEIIITAPPILNPTSRASMLIFFPVGCVGTGNGLWIFFSKKEK